jgi:hypothetical protein
MCFRYVIVNTPYKNGGNAIIIIKIICNHHFNRTSWAMVGPKLSISLKDTDYQGATVHSRIFMGTCAAVSVVYLQ